MFFKIGNLIKTLLEKSLLQPCGDVPYHNVHKAIIVAFRKMFLNSNNIDYLEASSGVGAFNFSEYGKESNS